LIAWRFPTDRYVRESQKIYATFEKLYDEFAEDIDTIAERIKILGFNAPGTLKEFLELGNIKEEEAGSYPNSKIMLSNVKNDIESIVKSLYNNFKVIQGDNNDEVTAGMILGMIERYEKHLWMINSTLED